MNAIISAKVAIRAYRALTIVSTAAVRDNKIKDPAPTIQEPLNIVIDDNINVGRLIFI